MNVSIFDWLMAKRGCHNFGYDCTYVAKSGLNYVLSGLLHKVSNFLELNFFQENNVHTQLIPDVLITA